MCVKRVARCAHLGRLQVLANLSQIRNRKFPSAKQKRRRRCGMKILKPLSANDLKLIPRSWHGLCIRDRRQPN